MQKNKAGKWSNNTNDISNIEFIENFKQIETPIEKSNNKSIVYIPTHNLNDVYEWFRLFKDSYAYSDNIDKYGFAIQAFFNKDRGQSIKGWFENLYEVKATSTDTFKYYSNTSNYYRSSTDYITDFTNIQNLTIDNTKINDGESILLKNQNEQQIQLFVVDQTISLEKYYVEINLEESNNFKLGSTIILRDINNDFYEDNILSLDFDLIGLQNYAIITVNAIRSNINAIADIFNSNWTNTSYDHLNGIYTYLNNDLILLSDMNDIQKTYNQIVYTYQGDTNKNKQFYLRRCSDKTNVNYSLFPVSNLTDPLYYSEGKAALIKAEFDYSLSIDSNIDNALLQSGCCECISNAISNNIIHPSGSMPYTDLDSNPFRLLYLDNSLAEKVFATDQYGIGSYIFNDLDMVDCDNDIQFYSVDKDLDDNIFVKYFEEKFFNHPVIDLTKSLTFVYNPLLSGETYIVDFNKSFITYSNTLPTHTYSTPLRLTYDGIQDQFPISITFVAGSSINLKFTDISGNLIFEDIYLILNSADTATYVDFEIFPKLDTNFYNDLLSKDDYILSVETINIYGTLLDTPEENINNLISKINKTIIGNTYNFKYKNIDLSQTHAILQLESIRQDNYFKYDNLGCTISYDSTTTYIEHAIDKKYRQYFYGYNINDYLNDYLGVNTTNIELVLDPITITYQDNNALSSYFQITGSNKVSGKGNIIKFGLDHKDIILNHIRKDTKISITIGMTTENNIWVNDVTFDYNTNIGEIVTLNYITTTTNTTNVTISQIKTIADVSSNLNTYTKNNLTLKPFNIDSSSYAYALSNYTLDNSQKSDLILNSVSAILYKDFKESKINILKRDRFFEYETDSVINVACMSINDIDITLPGISIDTYNLVLNDVIILNAQTDPTENGIYIFNTNITPLVRYSNMNLNDYYYILNGSVNLNKTVKADYNLPLDIGTTEISFIFKTYVNKKDPRLTIKPIQYAILGLDNVTRNFEDINIRHDIIEPEENLLVISKNINTLNNIRFIDGLTEYNIVNNINDQGKYLWILNRDVITKDAIVGKDSNGTLIWYSGEWLQGTWCNGIWYSGIWHTGIWVNGIMNSRQIYDNQSYVIISEDNDDSQTSWIDGTWVNGTLNGGIFTYVNWLNGTLNGATIIDGTWLNGIMLSGTINHILWSNGTLNGGTIETGIWSNGLVQELDPTIPAIVGIGAIDSLLYSNRFIWKYGIFDGGQFHSGDNTNHSLSVFYSGNFKSGDFYGGSVIIAKFDSPSIFHNGIFFGGYKCTISDTSTTNIEKRLTVNPSIYDAILGLTTLTSYIAHGSHDIKYTDSFYLTGIPVTIDAFSETAFINIHNDLYTTPYLKLPIHDINSYTDTTINLDILNVLSTTTYVTGTSSILDGEPFICSEFTGTFKSGVWLNGVFVDGLFETGLWVNGYMINGTIGIL